MGHNAGRITAPVNTDDVSAVLGVASHDVATLCTHQRINSAALYQPRYSSVNPGLNLQSTASNDGFQWIATQIGQSPDGTGSGYSCPAYGVWVPKYNISSTSSSLWNALFTASRRTWFIKKPDANSYKILDHFIGYDHNAKITKPIISPSVSKNGTSGNTISVVFTTPTPDGRTMSISNLFGKSSSSATKWYFGAVIFRGTNKDGWTTSDTMLVMGSSVAISNIGQTTVDVSVNDTGASQTTSYVYRIIPFVCDKAGLTSSKLSGTTFYGLGMTEEYAGWLEIKSGSVPGVDVRVNYFNWKDSNNGNYYPVPGNKTLASPITTGKAILIAYSETANLGTGKTLWDKYNRVDFTFEVVNVETWVHTFETYTWQKSGGTAGNGALVKDPNHNGSATDRMLFYINNDKMLTYPKEVSLAYADFYWTDDLGYARTDRVDADYIPDLNS